MTSASEPAGRERSLALLDALLPDEAGKRKQRSEELLVADDAAALSDPTASLDPSWAYWVPAAFRDALDIRESVRMVEKEPVKVVTQGGSFDFEQGAILYDSGEVYRGAWKDALGPMHHCLRVESASPASQSAADPGTVEVSVLEPDRKTGRLQVVRRVATTQYGLVRALITGGFEA